MAHLLDKFRFGEWRRFEKFVQLELGRLLVDQIGQLVLVVVGDVVGAERAFQLLYYLTLTP